MDFDFEPRYVNGVLCETYHEFYEARYEAIREAAERVRAAKEEEWIDGYGMSFKQDLAKALNTAV